MSAGPQVAATSDASTIQIKNTCSYNNQEEVEVKSSPSGGGKSQELGGTNANNNAESGVNTTMDNVGDHRATVGVGKENTKEDHGESEPSGEPPSKKRLFLQVDAGSSRNGLSSKSVSEKGSPLSPISPIVDHEFPYASLTRKNMCYKTYSPEDLIAALRTYLRTRDAGRKVSIRHLARVSGIPYATLRDHISGRKSKNANIKLKGANASGRVDANFVPSTLVSEINPSDFTGTGLQAKAGLGVGGVLGSSASTLSSSHSGSSTADIAPMHFANHIQKLMQEVTTTNKSSPVNTAVSSHNLNLAATASIAAVTSAALASMPAASGALPTLASVSAGPANISTQASSMASPFPAYQDGWEPFLKYFWKDQEVAEYKQEMNSINLKHTKQLEILLSTSKQISQATACGSPASPSEISKFKSIMRNNANYFQDVFAGRQAFMGKITVGQAANAIQGGIVSEFFFRNGIQFKLECVNTQGLNWICGVRFSQLVYRALAEISRQQHGSLLAPVGKLVRIDQLRQHWVSDETNLSLTLKQVEEKLAASQKSNVFDCIALLAQVPIIFAKADEVRGLIVKQTEEVLMDDNAVLAFRKQLFGQLLRDPEEQHLSPGATMKTFNLYLDEIAKAMP